MENAAVMNDVGEGEDDVAGEYVNLKANVETYHIRLRRFGTKSSL